MIFKNLKYYSFFVLLLVVVLVSSCAKGDEPTPLVNKGTDANSPAMRVGDDGDGSEVDGETIIGGDDNEDDDDFDPGTVIGGDDNEDDDDFDPGTIIGGDDNEDDDDVDGVFNGGVGSTGGKGAGSGSVVPSSGGR